MSNDDPNWPDRPPVAPPTSPVVDNLEAPPYVVQQEVIKSRGFGRFLALGIGLVFLGGVGVVAVTAFGGAGAGADSPEAAVEALAMALDQEDVIAALEVLAPSEVGTASDLYPRVLDLAVQEGALEDVDWLAGVDFQVTGLETRTEQLHDGVALVELVAGTFSVTVDPELADAIFLDGVDTDMSITVREMRDELAGIVDEQIPGDDLYMEFPFSVRAVDSIFVMTVKRDGGWFVSPFYTAAEYGRQMLDLPPADFSASRENAESGAGSAGAVIDGLVSLVNENRLEDLVRAGLAGDGDGLFEPLNVFVPPDEAGVFLDYADSYLTLVEDMLSGGDMSLDELRREFASMVDEIQLDGQATLQIDMREEARPDGAVVLHLESGSLAVEGSIVDPDTRELSVFAAELTWDGLCGQASMTIDGDAEEQVDDCIPVDEVPIDLDNIFVVVDKVGGDWYFSYVETGLAYAELILEGQLE